MKLISMLALVLLTALTGSPSWADRAIFAGGCFWCMEQAFQEHRGVQKVISGFTGGTLENPVYDGNHEVYKAACGRASRLETIWGERAAH
jgi:peptide-methionine (S)-S-oxide reductase